MNSQNHYVGCTLFPKASSVDSVKADRCEKSKPPKTSEVGTGSTQKRGRPANDKLPPAKKSRPSFRVGDCVSLHHGMLGKYHVPCLVIDAIAFAYDISSGNDPCRVSNSYSLGAKELWQ